MDEAALQLLLLGPMQLSIAGEPVSGLVSVKANALLAYLAAERRPCLRSELASLLWSDLPEEDARRNLRVEIARLRSYLAPYLLFTRHDAQLNPAAAFQVDLYQLEDLLTALQNQAHLPAVSQLIDAAALYRGDFLGGFQVRSAPLFDEWLLVERERQRQSAFTLLDKLVEVSIRQQAWKTGLSAARKILSIDNWREESHRQLMLLLAMSGDRSAALAQFEAARRILVQELGIEPGAETLDLYQRIKNGEVASPAEATVAVRFETPPPHNLPAPTTPFVGRKTELKQLDDLFADPGCRLLTLTGPGGTGKTRLALEFCWKLATTPGTPFVDGIYLIPLAAINDPGLLVSTMSDVLKIPGSGSLEPQEQLVSYLRDRQMLLILDNFEQLAETAPTLVEILHRAPGVKLLITSRHQLDLYEEWVFPVEGMLYPPEDDLANWQDYNAVQLFQNRALRVNLRFSMEQNRACIIRVCQLVEGLPLGIELAAAWVHGLPCENISRLIEQNLSLPENQVRNIPARQRSLQAVFQYSWDLLAEDEQRSLARMSVFQGGFTLHSAEGAAEARPRLLASLAAKSLLRFTPGGRYEMHRLLQSFSEEKLTSTEREAGQAAHCQYFASLLSNCAQDFAGPKETQVIDEISAEISNIRAAWQWLVVRIAQFNRSESSNLEVHRVDGAIHPEPERILSAQKLVQGGRNPFFTGSKHDGDSRIRRHAGGNPGPFHPRDGLPGTSQAQPRPGAKQNRPYPNYKKPASALPVCGQSRTGRCLAQPGTDRAAYRVARRGRRVLQAQLGHLPGT